MATESMRLLCAWRDECFELLREHVLMHDIVAHPKYADMKENPGSLIARTRAYLKKHEAVTADEKAIEDEADPVCEVHGEAHGIWRPRMKAAR